MADVHSHSIRRKNMRAIKNKNTQPEMFVRKLLHSRGFRYRLHSPRLPGKPDIVLAKYNAIIFVHGCFWHKHNCHLFNPPKTRTEFWLEKLNSNVIRDQKNIEDLIELGWRVLIVWECALKGKFKLSDTDIVDQIEEWIYSNQSSSLLTANELQSYCLDKHVCKT